MTAAQPIDLDKLEALARAVPEHLQLKGWYVAPPSFGHQHVYADNFKGQGRQHIASLPAHKTYFAGLAEFIAAANPATILDLITLARQQHEPSGNAGEVAASRPTDISQRLREYAGDPGYSHNDYADTMRQAAEEIERYYGGMMAWKQTAEKKDRDWNAERMARVNERCEARAAAPAAPHAQAEPVGYVHRDEIEKLANPRIAGRGMMVNKDAGPERVALYLSAPVPQEAEQRPTDDELWDATLRDRDAYRDWADKLADAISTHFGVDIGEHSNQNLPWAEALEAIESAGLPQEAEQAAPAAVTDASDELLDMLGRIHPFAMERAEREKAYERLERAFVIQQPWPVPDQACIVWRADLMDMRYDLVHKQACFDSKKEQPATPAVTDAARDLLAEIDTILKGIDQQETQSENGWWETSAGAEFGMKKLREVRAAIEAHNTAGDVNA